MLVADQVDARSYALLQSAWLAAPGGGARRHPTPG